MKYVYLCLQHGINVKLMSRKRYKELLFPGTAQQKQETITQFPLWLAYNGTTHAGNADTVLKELLYLRFNFNPY